jgi:hypothetical protein
MGMSKLWPILRLQLVRKPLPGLVIDAAFEEPGDVVFKHCALGCEGIVSKRLGSRYRSGRSRDWLKFKNPAAPAVKREAEGDWGEGPVAAEHAGQKQELTFWPEGGRHL